MSATPRAASWLAPAALALSLVGCAPAAAPPPPARVQGVVATAPSARVLDGFCEVRPDPPPVFEWPEVDGAAPTWDAGQWAWINVWATWCGPCIEELPRLRSWEAALRQELGAGALWLVSADEDRAALQTYVARHPGTPSLRLKDPTSLRTLLAGVGVDAGAALPVHLLLDGQRRIRCVRVGAVGDADRPIAAALLRGG